MYMQNQKELFPKHAQSNAGYQLSLVEVGIALGCPFILYALVAFANYSFGGPILRGHLLSLIYPLPIVLILPAALMTLATGIRKMQKEQTLWYTQTLILQGIGGPFALVFSPLIILEGLGNELFSPGIGWTLAGLCFILGMICLIRSIILSIGVHSSPRPKEAREE